MPVRTGMPERQNIHPVEVTLAIAQFAHILRHLGVRVSIAETTDVLQALNYVDLLDQRQFKGLLRALLVKSPQDYAIFERAFELFFLSGETKRGRLDFYRRQEKEEEQKLRAAEQELKQLLLPWQNHIPDKYQPTLESIQTFASLPALEKKRLKKIIAQMKGNPVNNPGELIAQVVQSSLNYWRYYLLKRRKEEEEVRSPDQPPTGEACFFRDPKEQMLYADLQNIKDEDLSRMTALIHLLSSRLALRLSRRHRRSRRAGTTDLRRTIRQNIRHGGVLLELRYHARRARRPRLVLICDVSASMARYARFVLQFIYGLSSAAQKIESFIFSENLERITPYFESCRDFPEAMAAVINESRQWGRTTNFYASLQTFLLNYRKLINSDATFIILSDTKTVSWVQAAGLLADLSGKVKDVLWLNPVPADEWSGLPAVAAFQKSARMFECSSLFHLEKIFRKKLAF